MGYFKNTLIYNNADFVFSTHHRKGRESKVLPPKLIPHSRSEIMITKNPDRNCLIVNVEVSLNIAAKDKYQQREIDNAVDKIKKLCEQIGMDVDIDTYPVNIPGKVISRRL